jgi:hypothetical protein
MGSFSFRPFNIEGIILISCNVVGQIGPVLAAPGGILGDFLMVAYSSFRQVSPMFSQKKLQLMSCRLYLQIKGRCSTKAKITVQRPDVGIDYFQ